MKIAIPMAEGRLTNHFGHCQYFSIIKTTNELIEGKEEITPPPHEPGLLPRWLHEMGVDMVIAGGMGARAINLFNERGIKVIIGAPNETPEVLVKAYIEGKLTTGANACDH
ncbi:MAG: Dinitrogenase iron-molybdenum cofactor [Alphaproteobacteria bacterium ADurb.Bin438]|nr:MAG: Dinitrogenase iron-molybdenum cofactor [Alphaproteobacteria bacterium ADurb.Bin438]